MKPHWTDEEIEYLENSWGQVPIPNIAKHLERSVNAVKLKAGRIGLGRHIHSGVRITLNQFSKALGQTNSYRKIKYHWARLGLPIHYQKSITKKYAMIDIDEFWAWAEHHKEYVDFSAFPEGTLGKEPEWVATARHASWLAKVKTTPWTPAEDRKLEDMLKMYHYTYSDLSLELNRTEMAIKTRIYDLGLPYRPLRNYNRTVEWKSTDYWDWSLPSPYES